MAAVTSNLGGFNIPTDTVIQTFLCLDLPSLGKVDCVCKTWKSTLDDTFWRQIQQRENIPNSPTLSAKELVMLHCNRIPLIYSYIGEDGVQHNDSVGHLYLGRRVIIVPDRFSSSMAARIAIKHPEMPNNSFVVYTVGGRAMPHIDLKKQTGEIESDSNFKHLPPEECAVAEKIRSENSVWFPVQMAGEEVFFNTSLLTYLQLSQAARAGAPVAAAAALPALEEQASAPAPMVEQAVAPRPDSSPCSATS